MNQNESSGVAHLNIETYLNAFNNPAELALQNLAFDLRKKKQIFIVLFAVLTLVSYLMRNNSGPAKLIAVLVVILSILAILLLMFSSNEFLVKFLMKKLFEEEKELVKERSLNYLTNYYFGEKNKFYQEENPLEKDWDESIKEDLSLKKIQLIVLNHLSALPGQTSVQLEPPAPHVQTQMDQIQEQYEKTRLSEA